MHSVGRSVPTFHVGGIIGPRCIAPLLRNRLHCHVLLLPAHFHLARLVLIARLHHFIRRLQLLRRLKHRMLLLRQSLSRRFTHNLIVKPLRHVHAR